MAFPRAIWRITLNVVLTPVAVHIEDLAGILPAYDRNFVHALHNKATIHKVTTMLATSKSVLFAGPNHLCITTGAGDPTL